MAGLDLRWGESSRCVEAQGRVQRRCPIQHDPRCTLRVGGGEDGDERQIGREPEDTRSLRANRVEHGHHVIDAVLEGGDACAVRQARSPDVHQDQPGEGGQALDPPSNNRLSRPVIESRRGLVARHVQEVEGPLADLFVGDVEIAAARVPDLELHEREYRLGEGDVVGVTASPGVGPSAELDHTPDLRRSGSSTAPPPPCGEIRERSVELTAHAPC
jgi:hypothetical protein